MIVLCFLYYWLEYFEPFDLYIYSKSTYEFNAPFLNISSLAVVFIVISLCLMIFLNKNDIRLKTYQSMILSTFVPGMGQASQGYLSWGIVLFFLALFSWISKPFPIPWLTWGWVVYIFNLFDCYSKATNMNIFMILSFIILNMLFPGIGQVHSGAIKLGASFLVINTVICIPIFWIPIYDGNLEIIFYFLPYSFIVAIFGLVTYFPETIEHLRKKTYC